MAKPDPEREFRTASHLPRERSTAGGPSRAEAIGQPARTRSPAACTPPATAGGGGPCGSTPASALPPSPTAGTAISSSRARPGSPWPSTAHQIGYDSDDPHRARRGRQGGGGDRQPRGHGDALRRHPARPGLHVDDDQRYRGILLALYVPWRGGGDPGSVALGTVQNDILKEYGRGDVDLPAARRCGW